MKKGNRVIAIGGDYKYPLPKGTVVFEDNWITKDDKVLVDSSGAEFNVTGFAEIHDRIICGGIPPYYKDFDSTVTRTCLRLDKFIRVGEVLFIK